MRIVLGALKERSSVSMVITRCIELSGLALACDTIAEDVMKMRTGGPEIAGFDDRIACLDDDPAAARCDQSTGGAQAGACSSA